MHSMLALQIKAKLCYLLNVCRLALCPKGQGRSLAFKMLLNVLPYEL